MARGEQLSRQWKIIQTLMAASQGKTKQELSQDLECHHRTVYRDLEALQEAGFPIYNEQRSGRTYWYLLDSDCHHMPLPLSLTELMALYFSRNMLKVLEGTAIYESLTSLFEKVTTTLPAAYTQYLEQLEGSLQVGTKAFKPYQHFQEIFNTVNLATSRQQYIEIAYYSMSRGESSIRKVAPYKIWFYSDTFYIIGHCAIRNDIRLFAVDRIQAIEMLEECFESPEDFDAQAFMEKSFGVFRGKPAKVRIHFNPKVAGYVSEKIWHPTQVLTPADDGGVIFEAEVAGIEEIKLWILRWGAGATVMGPDELVTAMEKEIRGMAENYNSNQPA